MRRPRRVMVVKREGTLEPFSLPKLRSCLARVLQACGREVPLADPLARAVAVHLRECGGEHLPTSEYIFRCACTVLMQTGLTEAAQELAAQRRLRAVRRRRVRVLETLHLGAPAARWRKGALVATLQDVYELRLEVARFLAGRIEEQVFGLGYRLVSKTLLAELVRNEVLAWGLLDAPVRALPAEAPCEGPVVSQRSDEES